jgi:hypothetical protein
MYFAFFLLRPAKLRPWPGSRVNLIPATTQGAGLPVLEAPAKGSQLENPLYGAEIKRIQYPLGLSNLKKTQYLEGGATKLWAIEINPKSKLSLVSLWAKGRFDSKVPRGLSSPVGRNSNIRGLNLRYVPSVPSRNVLLRKR